LIIAARTRQHTGKGSQMQRDCSESMASHFLTANSWKNGRRYRRKQPNVITARLAGSELLLADGCFMSALLFEYTKYGFAYISW